MFSLTEHVMEVLLEIDTTCLCKVPPQALLRRVNFSNVPSLFTAGMTSSPPPKVVSPSLVVQHPSFCSVKGENPLIVSPLAAISGGRPFHYFHRIKSLWSVKKVFCSKSLHFPELRPCFPFLFLHKRSWL